MPNGHSDFNEKDLPILEKFFGQFSDELEFFAESRNLLIDKYYHQFHSWRFSFKNPKGGIGALELIKESDSFVRVNSYWWIDDYDKFTRFSRESETVLIKAEKENIVQILEVKFAEVLSWDLNELTDVTDELENSWSRYSKEEFYKLNDKYPIPKF